MSHPMPLPHHGLKSVCWILVADGKTARVFDRLPDTHVLARNDGLQEVRTWAFRPVEDLQLRAEPASTYDSGKTAVSTVFERSGPLRHHSEPHVDLRRKLKRDLAERMAEALNRAALKRRFQRLVIVAPPVWLGHLRPLLSRDVRDMVDLEVAKDMARLSMTTLTERLRALLPERAEPETVD